MILEITDIGLVIILLILGISPIILVISYFFFKEKENSSYLNQPQQKVKLIQQQKSYKTNETEPESYKKKSLTKDIEITECNHTNLTKTILEKKEEYFNEKYIGYDPINIFFQIEPIKYPYVIMPNPNSIIKYPREGRTGRKGYKEEDFKIYIEKYFKTIFQIFDNRFLLAKNLSKPYEPDFTIIDEKNGINIFLDIEIDEPYEGSNDIQNRRPTHYQKNDTNRNNAFKDRGWIVIRFAEIQIHQEPDSCCRFIAEVIKSINSEFIISESLLKFKEITSINQWTKEAAEKWSLEKYREKYLGIDYFGKTAEQKEFLEIKDTAFGEKIEELVIKDLLIPVQPKKKPIKEHEVISNIIYSNKYLSFFYQNSKTIVKPIKVSNTQLTAFCFIKNNEITFNLHEIEKIELKNNYSLFSLVHSELKLEQIINICNMAKNNNKFLRIRYTRSAWTNTFLDPESLELITHTKNEEESIRTISNIELSLTLSSERPYQNYINAYCHKRDEQRSFRFDRISKIELLDL